MDLQMTASQDEKPKHQGLGCPCPKRLGTSGNSANKIKHFKQVIKSVCMNRMEDYIRDWFFDQNYDYFFALCLGLFNLFVLVSGFF